MRNIYFKKLTLLSVAAMFFFISGCGYTTQSLLPAEFKTIYIENFTNQIDTIAPSSNVRMYRGYKPGMELEVTRHIRNKYLFDGNLKVVEYDDADLILKGKLVDFRNEALRYDREDNVEEYRIRLVVDLELKTRDGRTKWVETNFAGEELYRTSGPLVESESTAIKKAADDLARRVVERTVEEW